VIRALKHGQRATRATSNEKKRTIDLELTLCAALIVRRSLGGTLWN